MIRHFRPPVSTFVGAVTVPVVGVNWTYTIPDHVIFHLININFEFDADGNVASRIINININNAAADVAQFPAGNSVIVNETYIINWAIHVDPAKQAAATTIYEQLPPQIWLYPGWVISSLTTGIQVGDQFDHIFLWMHQYLTPNVA